MATPLEIVTLARMKTELRIPATISDHDSIITDQISASISYISETTGRDLLDDDTIVPDALIAAAISLVRSLYSGEGSFTGNSMANSLIEPFILTVYPS